MANYSFGSTGAVQTVTIGKTGTYDIAAYGGQGGNELLGTDVTGGLGAETGKYFNLTAGEKLKIVVGAMGSAGYNAAGGGGSSVLASTNGGTSYSLLLASGGGGGAGYYGRSTTSDGGGGLSANSPAGNGGGGGRQGGGGGTAWGSKPLR